MRFICALFACFLSFSSFALIPENAFSLSECPQGLPTSDVNFCKTFKEVAICHCTATGIPRFLCKNMNTLYNSMILRYGSVENACQSQTDTTQQICMDSWSCYRSGGKNSDGELCSGTGEACG
jgi:hypothetical protein